MNEKRAGALSDGVTPPEEFMVDDLVIRRWRPDDLMPRFEAVTASYPALHPWMEWLASPPTIETQRAFGELTASGWPDADGSCQYGIFDAGGSVVGALGVHDCLGPGALELGYWCHIDHSGRGIITRSARELTSMSLALPGVDRMEIHCDAANVRSAAVARRIGYRLDRIEPRTMRAPAESGRGMIWVKPSDD